MTKLTQKQSSRSKDVEIRPIRTQQDYEVALREIEQLFDAASGTSEGDRLDVLTTLVSAYEDANFPIPEPDPIEAIKYYMESRGLTKRDLIPYLGDQKRVVAVLNRNQRLSITMIRKLHLGLGISADVLIQPYKARTRTTRASI